MLIWGMNTLCHIICLLTIVKQSNVNPPSSYNNSNDDKQTKFNNKCDKDILSIRENKSSEPEFIEYLNFDALSKIEKSSIIKNLTNEISTSCLKYIAKKHEWKLELIVQLFVFGITNKISVNIHEIENLIFEGKKFDSDKIQTILRKLYYDYLDCKQFLNDILNENGETTNDKDERKIEEFVEIIANYYQCINISNLNNQEISKSIEWNEEKTDIFELYTKFYFICIIDELNKLKLTDKRE